MATTSERPYFCYYVKNNVLYFRHEDGRNGGEPLNLKQETKEQAVQRLTAQLGLINPIMARRRTDRSRTLNPKARNKRASSTTLDGSTWIN